MQVLDRFLEAKGKVDSGDAANQEDRENQCIDAFHALTSVRALLASGLQGGKPSARVTHAFCYLMTQNNQCICACHAQAPCFPLSLQSHKTTSAVAKQRRKCCLCCQKSAAQEMIRDDFTRPSRYPEMLAATAEGSWDMRALLTSFDEHTCTCHRHAQ